jgi:4'-phosphopantetheinyl transferase
MANQDAQQYKMGSLWSSLSQDEKKRAERFHFQKDRDHFIIARGVLRILLGRYLNVSPEVVRLQYSAYGKPSLAEEFCSSRLRFNLSHSGGMALFAFAIGRDLGVDIEKMRADFATLEIARRYFSAQEISMFQSLPTALQTEAFFNCWTRKEAFIKAIGEGLSCPLDQFDVTLAPEEQAALLATRLSDHPASKWSIRSLDSVPGFKAAVAVEKGDWDLRCWTFAADQTTDEESSQPQVSLLERQENAERASSIQ